MKWVTNTSAYMLVAYRDTRSTSDWDDFISEMFAISPKFNETLIIHLYRYKYKSK